MASFDYALRLQFSDGLSKRVTTYPEGFGKGTFCRQPPARTDFPGLDLVYQQICKLLHERLARKKSFIVSIVLRAELIPA
jgi:hypothetical protein